MSSSATPEVNASAAAALLNATEVQAGLARRGIQVPDSTWFVPALHNTPREHSRHLNLQGRSFLHEYRHGG